MYNFFDQDVVDNMKEAANKPKPKASKDGSATKDASDEDKVGQAFIHFTFFGQYFIYVME